MIFRCDACDAPIEVDQPVCSGTKSWRRMHPPSAIRIEHVELGTHKVWLCLFYRQDFLPIPHGILDEDEMPL